MNVTKYYCVAGHRFGVTADEEYLRLMPNFEPFSDNTPAAPRPERFTLGIVSGCAPAFTEVFRQVDGEQVIMCGHTSDGSHIFGFRWCDDVAGWLICSGDYREGRLITTGNYARLAIDNALMIMYALTTATHDTLLFHAAAVSAGGRGYMFLGASGTGKSTHARLWLQHIPGAERINDDNPVVRIGADGVAMVYGSPWSGKIPCYRNVGYPIGAIVLLRQAPCNSISPLGGVSAYAAIMASVSGTRWDRAVADGLHAGESRLIGAVKVWCLQCLPDKEAALICESAITGPTCRLTSK